MKLLTRVAGWCLMVLSVAAQAQIAPDALVAKTVNEVLLVIKQKPDKKTLHDLAEKRVLPHFDFAAMTRLAVGRHWREASDSQKKALEDGFRSLLVSTYVAALNQSASSNQSVDVKPAGVSPGQDDVTVRTLVKEPGRQPISVDYRMALGTGGWKVYDVVVESLSLVTNYRGSFTSEIARSGIEGLIKTIDEKNRKLAES